MGSDIFFHGIREGETCEVKMREGKVLVIKLVEIKEPDADGDREVIFQVNGSSRSVMIHDKNAESKATKQSIILADADNDLEIGANIPGNIVKVLVKVGDQVKTGEPIAVIESMKMETNIISTKDGEVDKIYVKEGQQVVSGELIAELK